MKKKEFRGATIYCAVQMVLTLSVSEFIYNFEEKLLMLIILKIIQTPKVKIYWNLTSKSFAEI